MNIDQFDASTIYKYELLSVCVYKGDDDLTVTECVIVLPQGWW